jgi:hypothetical protein
MTAVTWNDTAGRTHALPLGDAPLREPCTHTCTARCVRALATERPACTLVSDTLQLAVRMRVVDAIPAPADECDVVVLRRSDVPEPAASHAADALYVLVMCARDASFATPYVAWGIGAELLVNCLLPCDTRVQDLFPLSLVRRQALCTLYSVVGDLKAAPRIVPAEEVEAIFGNSWLDSENVDARAMPERCSDRVDARQPWRVSALQ